MYGGHGSTKFPYLLRDEIVFNFFASLLYFACFTLFTI